MHKYRHSSGFPPRPGKTKPPPMPPRPRKENKMKRKIRSILGFETREADGTFYTINPSIVDAHIVGASKIELREENKGTYGISWYDIYKTDVETGKEYLHSSLNALRIEKICYFPDK